MLSQIDEFCHWVDGEYAAIMKYARSADLDRIAAIDNRLADKLQEEGRSKFVRMCYFNPKKNYAATYVIAGDMNRQLGTRPLWFACWMGDLITDLMERRSPRYTKIVPGEIMHVPRNLEDDDLAYLGDNFPLFEAIFGEKLEETMVKSLLWEPAIKTGEVTTLSLLDRRITPEQRAKMEAELHAARQAQLEASKLKRAKTRTKWGHLFSTFSFEFKQWAEGMHAGMMKTQNTTEELFRAALEERTLAAAERRAAEPRFAELGMKLDSQTAKLDSQATALDIVAGKMDEIWLKLESLDEKLRVQTSQLIRQEAKLDSLAAKLNDELASLAAQMNSQATKLDEMLPYLIQQTKIMGLLLAKIMPSGPA